MGRINKVFLSVIFCSTFMFSCFISAFCEDSTIHENLDGSPVSLKDCVLISLKNGFDVKLAKLDLYVAETKVMYSRAVFDTMLFSGVNYGEDKRQQLSVFSPDDNQTNEYYAGVSKKLPTGTQVGISADEKRLWSNSRFVEENPSHSMEMKLNARQNLAKNIFGYIDRKNVSIAKVAVEMADFESKDRIENFIYSVEKAYWDFVSKHDTLEIYAAILTKAKDLFEITNRNVDMGIQERVDIVASEANLNRMESEYLLSENDYREACENLKFLMNVNGDYSVKPLDGLSGTSLKGEFADYLNKAFSERRDYMAGKKNIEMRSLELKMTGNLKWPEIDLLGSLGVNGAQGKFNDAIDKLSGGDNVFYYAGIEFSFPLENRDARSRNMKASYENEKAIVTLKKIERKIIVDVGNAFRRASTINESISYIKKTVDLQSEKLIEEEKRFKTGRSNTKNIIDYQADLLRSQLEYTKFLLLKKNADIDLERTMNVILSKYKEELT